MERPKRLTLFLKGNVDVHDSLHSCRIGGQVVWNGINDVLRIAHPGWLARLKHETCTRADAILRSDGSVPEAIQARDLPLGSYPASGQFSRAVFETKADAIILSLQTEVATALVRHKKEGYLFYPSDSARWKEEDRRWLKSDFEPIGHAELAQSMVNLTALIGQIRKTSEVPILIYNMSPITPGEEIHCYQGLGEIFSTRIRRFNLGLVDLSEELGISIIDVDAIVARHGADALKLDTLHLHPPGYRLVAQEVVRVLADLGVFEAGSAGV